MVYFALLLNPSTIPEESPRASNQFSSNGSWRSSILAILLIGSIPERFARVDQSRRNFDAHFGHECRCGKPHCTTPGSRCVFTNRCKCREHLIRSISLRWRIEIWWEPTRAPSKTGNKPGAVTVAPDFLRSQKACYLGKAKNPNASILEMLEPFTHKFRGRAIEFLHQRL